MVLNMDRYGLLFKLDLLLHLMLLNLVLLRIMLWQLIKPRRLVRVQMRGHVPLEGTTS